MRPSRPTLQSGTERLVYLTVHFELTSTSLLRKSIFSLLVFPLLSLILNSFESDIKKVLNVYLFILVDTLYTQT